MTKGINKKNKRVICILLIISILSVIDFYLCAFVDKSGLSTSGIVNVSLDFLGIVILTILCHGYMNIYDERDRSNLWFFSLILVDTIALFSDSIAWMVQGVEKFRYVNYIDNIVFYLCAGAAFFSFWFYVKSVLKISDKLKKIMDVAVLSLSSMICVLLIINIPTGFIFDVDSMGVYSRKEYYYIYYIPVVITIAIELITVLISKNKIGEKITITIYFIAPIFCIVIQTIMFGISVIYIGMLCSIIIMYVSLQTKRTKEFVEHEGVMLLGQIKPHFIQNCLANIKGLMYTDLDEADEMILNLSGYLRDSFSFVDEREEISFEKEIELSDFYLAIEQKRFPDSFTVEKRFEIVDFTLPPLSLEPIIENAIKHGIREKNDMGHLLIETKLVESYVHIIVKDDGVGFNKKEHKPGVGLSNVERRLFLLTGGSVNVESEVNVGTTVTIILPRKGIK